MKLNKNMYLLLAGYVCFMTANVLQLNRYLIAGFLALSFVVLLRVLWRFGQEVRGWSDLGDALRRYLRGDTCKDDSDSHP